MLVTYLRLFRIHTAALTWAAALIGYMVAGGQLFSFEASIILLWATIWHAAGFLDNNVMDYDYDMKDPAKQHFPLMTGEVSVLNADFLVKIGLALMLLIGAWLAVANTYALVPLGLSVLAGLIYNRYNKRTFWKGMPISTCFAMVPMFAFMATGSNPTPLIGLVTAYIYIQISFQITVSGELKEIEASSEKSILRALGAKVWEDGCGDKHFLPSNPFTGYAALLKLAHLGFAVVISNFNPVVIVLALIIYWISTRKLILAGRWNRDKRLRHMSIVEILSYYLLVLALYPTLGLTEIVVMIIAPTVWFILFNKIIWGSTISPKV